MGRPMLKVAVLDDYQGVAERFADWTRVRAQCAVEFFGRPLHSVDEAATALADFDIVCLMRERMPVPGALLQRLPKLKLICVTGAHARSAGGDGSRHRGISHRERLDRAPYERADLGADSGGCSQHRAREPERQGRGLADYGRPDTARPHTRSSRFGSGRQNRGAHRRRFRHEPVGVEPEPDG